MVSLAPLNTYKHHFDVAALERLEEVRHPSLQTTTNEHIFIDVIQKDGSESIGVTWNTEGQTHLFIYFLCDYQIVASVVETR